VNAKSNRREPADATNGLSARDTSISIYRARRDFTATPEPVAPEGSARAGNQQDLVFVVQEHHARRLHWDFRLQHGDVLWSWAVPKAPPEAIGEKRLAVRTEDHPLDYAAFEGEIPEGHYGAGKVQRWDHGSWAAVGDPAEALAKGELKFRLRGERLTGPYVLIRMKPKASEKSENWLLIREREREATADAPVVREPPRSTSKETPDLPPTARRAPFPRAPRPQLATLTEAPPDSTDWLAEIKFDGYRLLVACEAKQSRIITRNGHDWSDRMPSLAREVAGWKRRMLVDGELVALREDGISDFGKLQAALAAGQDGSLVFQAFDLLHLDGWDLRGCRQDERKALLAQVLPRTTRIRDSGHLDSNLGQVRRQACAMGLEGVILKQAGAPYAAGRSKAWLKLKCQGREEFVVLGFTPPEGSRVGIGSLHVGHFDSAGTLHYAGGVGSGFDDRQLESFRARLGAGTAKPAGRLLLAGDPPDARIRWVEPRIVVELQFTAWSGAGRLRHAVFLGEREDKDAAEIVREPADAEAERRPVGTSRGTAASRPRRSPAVVPPRSDPVVATTKGQGFVVARAPKDLAERIEGIRLTHPERELWPGISKMDLARYWVAVARHALPGLAVRPLALVRCPEGIEGETFFQKHAMRGQPAEVRAGDAGGNPYLAIDGVAGLVACAQLSAIELHAWGATEADPDRPDQLVFDLDPDEAVPWSRVVEAAHEIRDAVKDEGLVPFCRTTGGKGLHVVVPLTPKAGWDEVKAYARGFAEGMTRAAPDAYVTKVSKALRRGRILIDWLRNGKGATAVASFCPRARPGATVATPLQWREVTAKLDPRSFTVGSVPERLAGPGASAWDGFEEARRPLPPGKGK